MNKKNKTKQKNLISADKMAILLAETCRMSSSEAKIASVVKAKQTA